MNVFRVASGPQHVLETLPWISPLPYELSAFASESDGFLSWEQISVHYEKHHKGYVRQLVTLLSPFEDLKSLTLEEIIAHAYAHRSACDPHNIFNKIFNNSAQIYNHNQFWASVTPHPDQNPLPDWFLSHITNVYETQEAFKKEFKTSALQLFGSGWTWLVWSRSEGNLKIVNTGNAECPLMNKDFVVLLACDVWEHAYYIDYQNLRADFVDNFLKHINWTFAAKILKNELDNGSAAKNISSFTY